MASPATQHKPKLFYGWVIVAVMAAAGALSMGMGTLNFGLFIKPMGAELGIGRAAFGWSQTARQAASAVTSPLIGRLIDRFGSRVLLPVAALFTALAMVGLAYGQSAWFMIAMFAVMGLVGMGGPGSLVTSVPVAKWFVRKRGRAFSFMALGIPIGGVIFVPLTQLFINAFGWRNAWIALAALGGGLIIPLGLLLVRRQPEDMGLNPDGAEAADQAGRVSGAVNGTGRGRAAPAPARQDHEEESWTVREALRSPAFWGLVAVFSIVTLAVSSVGVHRIPHFMDQGLDPGLVSAATALDAAAAGVSTFVLGFVAERVPGRIIGAAGFVVAAFAIYLTIGATTAPMMFAAMITFGTGMGSLMLLRNFLFAQYFGRAHLGGIQGVMMPVTLVFGGAGAPLAGYVYDATGAYDTIWWAGLIALVAGAGLLVMIKKPKKATSAEQPAKHVGSETFR
jgi:predicted MFS family arabinose efflux permease